MFLASGINAGVEMKRYVENLGARKLAEDIGQKYRKSAAQVALRLGQKLRRSGHWRFFDMIL